MKRFCVFIFAIGMFFLLGCGSPKEPAEPTPDLQANVMTTSLMEQLFVDLQYAYFLTTETMNVIENNLLDYGETNKPYIKEIIDYFNSPGKLADRLDTKLKLMQRRKIEIETNSSLDAEAFKNLTDLMNVYKETVDLVTTLPSDYDGFVNNRRRIDQRFDTLIRLLKMKFPQANAELMQRKSPESPELRSDMRLIESIPSPPELETPDGESSEEDVDLEPTAIPTYTPGPVGVWRDEKGNIHMGQRPAEEGQMMTLPPASQTIEETSPTTEIPQESQPQESGSSKIWTDEEGNVHMSSDTPPEGVESKEAGEIPLLIGD